MTTHLDLRDLGLSAGQSRREQVELTVQPYRQSGVSYVMQGSDTVPAQLDVTVMASGMHLRLRFDAKLVGPCARCLEDAVVPVHVDSHEVHDPAAGDDDLVSEFVDDDQHRLDLAAWAQTAVGLEFPARVLCREDCAGLCTQCGTNLNASTCDCTVDTHDPRWDALKGLKLDDAADE